jgi:ribosomal protein S18 acetylase RimI-like enzyme
MSTLRFILQDGEPDPEDKKALVNGLLSHHEAQGHKRKTEVFSIFLKDENNKMLGGIMLSFLWGGMHIDSLWVDESARDQGWGKKLVEQAEREGRKRGCTIAYTDTFTWQAPEFYKKLGYLEYGKLEDFPDGNSLTYFFKKL